MRPVEAPARTLFIVSGARDALPVIAQARRMGLRVIVSDGAHDAPGFRVADAGLLAGTRDPDATVEAARAYATQTRIDAVLGVGPEVAATAAAVADALGLPAVSPTIVALAADRLALHKRLRELGIAVPWSTSVSGAAAIARLAGEREGPLAVRPVDAGGGLLLLPGTDPAWAFQLSAATSPTERVMVEEVVRGPGVHTESLVVAGRPVTVFCADTSEGPGAPPGVVNVGWTLPSRLHPARREEVDAVITAALAGIGVRTGPVGCDLVIGARGPVLTALAPRLAGGWLATHDIPLATGLDFVGVAIRLALGEEAPRHTIAANSTQAVARRFLRPAAGTVVAVQGVAEAAAGEGIMLLEVQAIPGQRLLHGGQAGVVVAVGDTYDVAAARAEAALARVRVVTAAGPARVSATLH